MKIGPLRAKFIVRLSVAFVDLPEVAANETIVGGIGRGIVQFTAGYATFSNVYRPTRDELINYTQGQSISKRPVATVLDAYTQ